MIDAQRWMAEAEQRAADAKRRAADAELRAVDAVIRAQRAEDATGDSAARAAQAELCAAEGEIRLLQMHAQLEQLRLRLEHSDAQIRALDHRLRTVYASRSWQITGPLRALDAWLSRLLGRSLLKARPDTRLTVERPPISSYASGPTALASEGEGGDQKAMLAATSKPQLAASPHYLSRRAVQIHARLREAVLLHGARR